MPQNDSVPRGEIVAKASAEYRVKRYIMVVVLVGFGLWNVFDGYYLWPKENEEAKAQKIDKLPHTATDILINRALAWTLPPLGLALLAYALRNSRGVYRVRDKILTVPGHPPIPFAAIRSLDTTDWERKGIAYVNYELPNGKSGSARLDDFIYQREPTDEIFKVLEGLAAPAETKKLA